MILPHILEAILFASAEPMSYKELARVTGEPLEEVKKACDALSMILKDRGIILVKTDMIIELRTHPDAAEYVSKALEESYTTSIGPAGSEVLAILLFHGASTRGDIEHIRGVNSGSTLRLLSMRGLIRRVGGEGRAYEVTEELLAHLGVTKREDLPSFEETKEKLSALKELRNDHGTE